MHRPHFPFSKIKIERYCAQEKFMNEEVTLTFPPDLRRSIKKLYELMNENKPDGNTNSNNEFLRGIQYEAAKDAINEAIKSFNPSRYKTAWSHLVQAAISIGFLIGSREFPNSNPTSLDIFRESGKVGGTRKGEKYKKIEEDIVAELLKAKPEGGWKSRNDIRREYNNIVAKIEDYKETPKKWQAIMRRAEIIDSLSIKTQ